MDYPDYVDGVGLFTDAQRRYLLGERTYDTRQGEIDMRQRIRDRLRNAPFDYSVLLANLDPKDRKQVFEKTLDPWVYEVENRGENNDKTETLPEPIVERIDRFRGLVDCLTYHLLWVDEIDVQFDKIVELALRQVVNERVAGPYKAMSIQVDVDIEVDYLGQADPDEAIRKIERGQELSNDEFVSLFNLYFEDNDAFVEQLGEIPLDVESEEEFSRGESLAVIAAVQRGRIPAGPALADRMDPDVRTQFGL